MTDALAWMMVWLGFLYGVLAVFLIAALHWPVKNRVRWWEEPADFMDAEVVGPIPARHRVADCGPYPNG